MNQVNNTTEGIIKPPPESSEVGKEGLDEEDQASHWTKKYRKLNEMMVELVHDFRLVEFQSLNVMDPESMQNVINAIDRSNGYVRTADERKFAETGQSTYIEELAQAHGKFWEGGDIDD